MACRTCDHTMQRVSDGEPPVFWCPRCGTLKSEGYVPLQIEEPKLVGRVRVLLEAIDTITDDEHPNIDALEYPVRNVEECIRTP